MEKQRKQLNVIALKSSIGYTWRVMHFEEVVAQGFAHNKTSAMNRGIEAKRKLLKGDTL